MHAPRIDLVYFNAGGGHRAAALALEAAIKAQGWPWQVRRVDLSRVLDRRDIFGRTLGIAPEDLYNFRLARGWTFGLAQELRLLQAAIRLAHGPLVRRLTPHWADSEPDLVVSLIPNFNRALCESLAIACPGVPFVTVLTDLADLPPHFWIEPGLQQDIVCGSDEAVAQAQRAGYGAPRIRRVSGMLLRQAFHAPELPDKPTARARIGLQSREPAAVVMYGAFGSSEMVDIARALPELPLVLMCGRNRRLAERLRALPGPGGRRVVVEFTEDVPGYLRAADFFIGKPGPGCLSEALHLGLPVITFGNRWTMPQERFNVRWVAEQGVGLAVRSVSELPAAVATLQSRMPQFLQSVARLRNRASFEVPQILAGLLQRSQRTVSDLHPLRLPNHGARANQEVLQ